MDYTGGVGGSTERATTLFRPEISQIGEMKKRVEKPVICVLFSNHSAVKREQIIFTLETMKRRQESGIGISFIDS